MRRITLLGTGLIGTFYARALHGLRSRDRVVNVYSRDPARAAAFAQEHGIPRWSSDLAKAVRDPESEVVAVGIPNHVHAEAVGLAAEAGKAVLCTKPLGRTASEALAMFEAVEKAGVFHGYLEDLVFTPKTLKALASVRGGAIGRILWTRSRETHPGPHSAWFWDPGQSGGGALIDMGCHCIEIGRSFVGKDVRPVEAFAWGATQVHPIDAEDHAVGLIKYADGALAQLEVSWTFRGGMDLRDEVAGTEGTIRLDHFLRTGFEMFSAAGEGGYVAEKAEGRTGWLFPVGDEVHELGYIHMFQNMLDALDAGRFPLETFYDGYVVNAVIDACYRSMGSGRWEPVQLDVWRGPEARARGQAGREAAETENVPAAGLRNVGWAGEAAATGSKEEERPETSPHGEERIALKKETMPDGRIKIIYRDPSTGKIFQEID